MKRENKGESIGIELQLIFTGGSTHKYITIIVHYRRERKTIIKKVTTIKESASVYSGKTPREYSAISDAIQNHRKKSQKRVRGDFPSKVSFRKLPHGCGTLRERLQGKRNGHHLQVDCSEFVSLVGA